MTNLASTYRNQWRWKEVEELEVQVVKTKKRVLGQQHPDTLTSMANLAAAYRNQERWEEAKELDAQVVEMSRKVLVQEHPDTLASMANLASIYLNQGQWKYAEELEVKVMGASKKVLGQEHPDALTSMTNLASTSWVRRARRTGQARPRMYFFLCSFPWSSLITFPFQSGGVGRRRKGCPSITHSGWGQDTVI